MTGAIFPCSIIVVRYSTSSMRSFAITARSRWFENTDRRGAPQDAKWTLQILAKR